MLIINIDDFALNKRNEILDETGKLIFWSQPDFAYKQRVHIYDDVNNEIGYVQYKILSIQEGNEIYDSFDSRLDLSGFKQLNMINIWTYDIELNGSIVASIKEGKIEIADNSIINKCLLFIFSLIEKGE